MTLPSPIPHPLSYLDNVGSWRDAVAWIVGSDWPEGDEKAMRELAEQWRKAAARVRPVWHEAGQVVSTATASTGDSPMLREAWRRLGSGMDLHAFERLADLAEQGAREIEAAKLDIYAEVAESLAELENLAALDAARPGALAAGGPAVLTGAREGVKRAMRRAVGEMLDRPAPEPFAFPQLSSSEDAGHSPGTGPGTGPETVPERADPSAANVLLMATGIASLGGSSSSAPRPRVSALKGRYGERAIRSRTGAVLRDISIGVITKDDVALARSAERPALAARPVESVASAPDSFTLAALGEGGAPDLKAYEAHLESMLSAEEDAAAQNRWAQKVQRSEGVAQPAHQRALEDAFGGAQPFPSLDEAWLRLVNGPGCVADPRRASNTPQVVQSVLDTWASGQPRAASVGTQIEWEECVALPVDGSGVGRLEAALRVQGHGASAILVQEWAHGEAHAVTVHNRNGEIVYVDAQRLDQPVSREPLPGAVRLEAVAFNPEGNRIDLAR